MRREDALARLRPLEGPLRAQGLSALYVFGSTARDQAGGASDLDLLYETDPAGDFSLLDHARIEADLSTRLGARIDLVSDASLHPRLRPRVQAERVRVF